MWILALCFGTLLWNSSAVNIVGEEDGHHHHHHHGKHHTEATATNSSVDGASTPTPATSGIVEKMKAIEVHLAQKATSTAIATQQTGHLLVNGPLPADFSERFSQAVGKAAHVDPNSVQVKDSTEVEDAPGVVEITFDAPDKVVKTVEDEAADPDSKLATGNLRSFLVAKTEKTTVTSSKDTEPSPAPATPAKLKASTAAASEVTPVQEKGIDIDTAMPYGDLEPFGREDTAQELTENAVTESDEMVDQLERAEVAEEKRAVFRALTRLRGAAITSFDGVARSQTGNIDEYNKIHKWRKTHPLHHLADEESDINKWAFPDNADF